MRRRLFFAVGLGLAACGTTDQDPPPADAGTLDAGPSDAGAVDVGFPDSGLPPPCTLVLEVPTLAVGATYTATVGGVHDRAEVTGVPAGWRATFVDARTLEVQASYGVGPAEAPLTITLTCGDRTQVEEVSLSARALAFTPLPTWGPGTSGPLAREYFSMWIDPATPDRLWLYGGFHYVPRQFTTGHDVWSLDLIDQTWTPHADGPERALPGAGVARLPDGRVYRYGGLNFNALPGDRDTPFVLHRVDTSTRGLSFVEPPVSGPSYGDYQPSFFHHPRTGLLYAVCGLNDQVGAHCEVSAYDPAAGTFRAVPVTGPAPVGRNGHFWAYDENSDRLIVFSGEGYPGTNNCRNCQQDTWALELGATPFRWVQLPAPGAPVGRRNGAYVLDPLHHRLFVWGGTPDGRNSAPGLWALDLTPGEEAWHEVPTTGDARVRTSGAAVYDAPRRRLLFGFGNNPTPLADLWALSLD